MAFQVLNQILDVVNNPTRGERRVQGLVGHWIHEDKSHFVV